MPENNMNANLGLTTDDVLLKIAKRQVFAYREIGLLEEAKVNLAEQMNDIEVINKILDKMPNLQPKERMSFANAFIGKNLEYIDMASPVILADAYRYAFEEAAKDKNDTQKKARLNTICKRVDSLIDEFQRSSGTTMDGKALSVYNVADIYEGYVDMMRARLGDLDRFVAKEDDTPAKKQELEKALEKRINEMHELDVAPSDAQKQSTEQNIAYLDSVISAYDANWGLNNININNAEKIAPQLSGNWEYLMDALNEASLSEDTLAILKRFNFLDNRERNIRQFKLGGRVDRDGRLGTIVTLARMDVAKKHVSDVDSEIDEESLEQELNDAVLAKMYEMFHKTDGGDISDKEYTDALSLQVNATGGWCARMKGKLGAAGSELGDFYEKVFSRQRRFDKLANVRMAPSAAKDQVKRIDMFKRILKGLASAFVASALITVIASAAAAAAGVSLAASMAAIGVVTGLGLSIAQVIRWRKRHPEATIQDFLGDTRLITSLGVSAIAMAAMCFGAAGMAVAAKSLGYGAIALGGTKNTVEMFRDARASGKSVAESLAWGIATAIAVAGGGFFGRALGQGIVNAVNEYNPDNKFFQNAKEHHAQREVIDEQREVSRTTTQYPDGMVERAENAVRQWYAVRYPNNPEILQQNIDAVNQYNIEHGTDLNPWTTLRAMAYAGNPNHGVYTGADWQNTYGYTPEQINAAAHAINPDGSYNPEGMAILNDLQVNHMDAMGRVGATNHFRNTTYSPLGETPTQTTETHTETISHMEDYVDRVDYTPTNDEGMAAFGNYTPKFAQVGRKLRDRVGRFMERVRGNEDKDEQQEISQEENNDQPIFYEGYDVDTPEENSEKDIVKSDQYLHEAEPQTSRGSLTEGQHERSLVARSEFQDLYETLNKDENQIGTKPHEPKLLGTGETKELIPVPAYDEPKVEQELRLGIEYSDAKRWEVLNQNIAREMSRKRPDYRKIETWKQEQRHLYNQLGRPDMEEFEIARTDAFRRHNLEEAIRDYKNYVAKRPLFGTISVKAMERWEKKSQSLADRIERLGGFESLDTSHLYFPVPVQSESRKRKEEKWARLDAEKAERDATAAMERESRGLRAKPINPRVVNARPVSPVVENPFDITYSNQKPVSQEAPNVSRVLQSQTITEQPVQKEPVKVAPNLSHQITDIRGVPVELMPIDGNGNYMGQDNGVPIVLTKVNKLNIAFYLDVEHYTWRLVPLVDVEHGVFVEKKLAGCPETVKIIAELNKQIGINYSAKNLPPVDISMLCDELTNSLFWDPEVDNYRNPYIGNQYRAKMGPEDLYYGLSLVKGARWPFRFLTRIKNDDGRK